MGILLDVLDDGGGREPLPLVLARGHREVLQEVGFGIRGNLEALSLGFYFAELAEAVAVEDSAPGELLRHLLNGLHTLSTPSRPLPLVKAAFELKFLCVAGFAPLADSCARCGRGDPASPVLDPVRGVVYCRDCAPGASAPLCPDSLAALRHVVYGDEKRLYSFRLTPEPLQRFSDAAERFVFAQMERRFRTLEFYKSLAPG